MTAEQNAEVKTFRVGHFMCATMASKSEAAMALIKAPGGTAQRMHARLRAVEMLVRDGKMMQTSSSPARSDSQPSWS
jgi:hypothetical protein